MGLETSVKSGLIGAMRIKQYEHCNVESEGLLQGGGQFLVSFLVRG